MDTVSFLIILGLSLLSAALLIALLILISRKVRVRRMHSGGMKGISLTLTGDPDDKNRNGVPDEIERLMENLDNLSEVPAGGKVISRKSERVYSLRKKGPTWTSHGRLETFENGRREVKVWERGPDDSRTYEYGGRGREELMIDLTDEYRSGKVSYEEYRAEMKRLTGE